MKSVVALAAFVGGMVSLQGCGGGDDTTTPTPYTGPCDYETGQADHFVCPGHGDREVYTAYFRDILQGDQKVVTFNGNMMTISVVGVDASVNLTLDEATCSGSVTFPWPPDGPQLATVHSALEVEENCKTPLKYVISFTDPATGPGERSEWINQWIEANPREDHVESTNMTCPTQMASQFAGFAGALWEVEIDGASLTLRPDAGRGENWTVEGEIDASDCTATVDFNVPGNPHPPATGALSTAQVRLSVDAGQTVKEAMASSIYYVILGDADGPTDFWTQVAHGQQLAASVITA